MFAKNYLDETVSILSQLDINSIEEMAKALSNVKQQGGRLFVLGVGGSAGHASHAVNDFRKLCDLEAYAPTDNVSELTARANDEGWESTFDGWLRVSRLNEKDALLIFSVGGGNIENNISVNLVNAINLAISRSAKIFSIVGRDGGYAAAKSNVAVLIPPLISSRITPHTEGLAAVVWHLLVSHPDLQLHSTKWEAVIDERKPEY